MPLLIFYLNAVSSTNPIFLGFLHVWKSIDHFPEYICNWTVIALLGENSKDLLPSGWRKLSSMADVLFWDWFLLRDSSASSYIMLVSGLSSPRRNSVREGILVYCFNLTADRISALSMVHWIISLDYVLCWLKSSKLKLWPIVSCYQINQILWRWK